MRSSSSNTNSFSIVLFVALAVIILSFVLINFDYITGHTSSDDYVSYVVSDHVSVYELADSLCAPGDNVWEVVYELQTANSLGSDIIAANSVIRIPASILDTGNNVDSIFLCEANQ